MGFFLIYQFQRNLGQHLAVGNGLHDFPRSRQKGFVFLPLCDKLWSLFSKHSSVAQLAEQSAVNRWVAGSSPARGAIAFRCATLPVNTLRTSQVFLTVPSPRILISSSPASVPHVKYDVMPENDSWLILRADAENRIKQLKEDFGAESFNMQEFFATEAALNFVILAYNLMSLFRQVVLSTAKQQQMKTLRYRIFASSGYIVHRGNLRILKLSIAMKRRKWFLGLFSKVSSFTFPIAAQT